MGGKVRSWRHIKIPVDFTTYCNHNVWYTNMAGEFGSVDSSDLFDEVSVLSIYLVSLCSQSSVSVLRNSRGRPPIRPRIDSGLHFSRLHAVRTFRGSVKHPVEPGSRNHAEFLPPSLLRPRSVELATSDRLPGRRCSKLPLHSFRPDSAVVTHTHAHTQSKHGGLPF